MPKFRKKPIVVEAEQFFPDKFPWPIGVESEEDENSDIEIFVIYTLEGQHEVTSGDWIITGIKGELYPCKPDIFEQTYEKVEDIT